MARARNIKPSFFKNEQLVELGFDRRLLFIGLWTLADREGRLEDRPKRIKMEIFPADDVNVEKALVDLHASGFILRYEVNGGRYIEVLKFLKHQTPHYKEAVSTIPKPEVTPGNDKQINPGLLVQSSTIEPKANPVAAPPDSLIPDSGSSDSLQTPLSPALPTPNCPQQEIIGLYGEILPMLTQPRDWSSARAGALQARWKYCAKANGFSPGYGTKDEGIAFWRKYFSYVSSCEKLTGKMPPRKPGDEPWKPDLPWLVKAENFLKVIEGKYAT